MWDPNWESIEKAIFVGICKEIHVMMLKHILDVLSHKGNHAESHVSHLVSCVIPGRHFSHGIFVQKTHMGFHSQESHGNLQNPVRRPI